jgi:hypothetical protein
MNTLEVLIASRAVIANEANWCKYIRDNSLGAHCALGAIDAVLGVVKSADYHPATIALATAMTPAEIKIAHKPVGLQCQPPEIRFALGLAQFNNGTTHDQVLALWDRAIERQKLIEEMGRASKSERDLALSLTQA